MAEMDNIGLKNRSILAQLPQMSRIWLGFGEIDLIFRSIPAQMAEMDKIGLKNRSILAQRLQLGSLWRGFSDIEMLNSSNKE